MSNAWGVSWGSAWGSSWGGGIVPPILTKLSIGGPFPKKKKKNDFRAHLAEYRETIDHLMAEREEDDAFMILF